MKELLQSYMDANINRDFALEKRTVEAFKELSTIDAKEVYDFINEFSTPANLSKYSFPITTLIREITSLKACSAETARKIWDNLNLSVLNEAGHAFPDSIKTLTLINDYVKMSERPKISLFSNQIKDMPESLLIKFINKNIQNVKSIPADLWSEKLIDAARSKTEDSIFFISGLSVQTYIDYFYERNDLEQVNMWLRTTPENIIRDEIFRKKIIERYGYLDFFRHINALRNSDFPTKEEIILSYETILNKKIKNSHKNYTYASNWSFLENNPLKEDFDIIDIAKKLDLREVANFIKYKNLKNTITYDDVVEFFTNAAALLTDRMESAKTIDAILNYDLNLVDEDILVLSKNYTRKDYLERTFKIKFDHNSEKIQAAFLDQNTPSYETISYIKDPKTRITNKEYIFDIWQKITISEFRAIVRKGIIANDDLNASFFLFGYFKTAKMMPKIHQKFLKDFGNLMTAPVQELLQTLGDSEEIDEETIVNALNTFLF